MAIQDMQQDDPLSDFDVQDITLNDATKRVYVTGTGPAVIVMAEMPGISPQVARFARWVRDAGFTVYMPSLFGQDGAEPTAEAGAEVFQHACVSAEFRALSANRSSPVTQWLRSLAKRAHEECGGPGVGAIGMCFTGNFGLTMMLEKSVIASVMAQPSLPLNDPAGIEISPQEIDAVRTRMEEEDLSVLAYRFEGDNFCQAQRFQTYREKLGDRFVGKTLPDSAANTDVPSFFGKYVTTPHSVLTAHLIDEDGQPTIAARDEVIAWFTDRLQTVLNAES